MSETARTQTSPKIGFELRVIVQGRRSSAIPKRARAAINAPKARGFVLLPAAVGFSASDRGEVDDKLTRGLKLGLNPDATKEKRAISTGTAKESAPATMTI
jgi:hypothetical protein